MDLICGVQFSIGRFGFDARVVTFDFFTVNINDMHTILIDRITLYPLRGLRLHLVVILRLFGFFVLEWAIFGTSHSVGCVFVWVIYFIGFDPCSLDSASTHVVVDIWLLVKRRVSSTWNFHMTNLFGLRVKVSLTVCKTIHVAVVETIENLRIVALGTQ